MWFPLLRLFSSMFLLLLNVLSYNFLSFHLFAFLGSVLLLVFSFFLRLMPLRILCPILSRVFVRYFTIQFPSVSIIAINYSSITYMSSFDQIQHYCYFLRHMIGRFASQVHYLITFSAPFLFCLGWGPFILKTVTNQHP